MHRPAPCRTFRHLVAASLAPSVLFGCAGGAATQSGGAASRPSAAEGRAATGNPTAGARSATGSGAAAGEGVARTSVAFPTGDRASSAVLIERATPRQAVVGALYQYDITVTNLTGAPLAGVAVSEAFAESFEFEDATPPVDATRGGRSAVWNLGQLAPRQAVTLRVRGTPSRPGPLNSCATVTFGAVACQTAEGVSPALRVVKSMPASATPCDPIPVRITVTNAGTGVARGVRLRDELPPGLTGPGGRRVFESDLGDLGAGESRTATFDARAAGPGEYANSVVATAGGGLRGVSEEVATDVRQPELAVDAQCPRNVMLGRTAAFRFVVRNTGGAPAPRTVVTAPVPGGTAFVSADNGGTVEAGSVVWRLGALGPGEARTVSLNVRAGTVGTIPASATATAECATAAADSCSAGIEGVPDIGTTVTDTTGVVGVGEDHPYQIEVKNQGQVALTDTRVSVTLPEDLEYVATTAPGEPRRGERGVEFFIGTVPPGHTVRFTMTLRGLRSGEHLVVAETTAAEIETPIRDDELTNFVDP